MSADADNRLQKCADLARKMFPNCEILISGNGVEYLPPQGTGTWRVFDPYESAADSRALVAWACSSQSGEGFNDDVFLAEVSKIYRLAAPFSKHDLACAIWEVLNAPLPVIADAAWLAIQEKM